MMVDTSNVIFYLSVWLSYRYRIEFFVDDVIF